MKKARFGLLYDASFVDALAGHRDRLDLLEVVPDGLFVRNDDPILEPHRIFGSRPAPPIVFHSLGLSLGADQPLDDGYVDRLCDLARRLDPLWASDHLAISRLGSVDLGHLSPIRWSAAAIDRVATKIARLQDRLRIPFLVENIAYYFRIPGADLSEVELLGRIAVAADCGLLLDLNNVAVNAANHGFDPYAYLRSFPLAAVREIHVAGHRRSGALVLDSHDRAVSDLVWDLLRFVSARVPEMNLILERDDDIPPLAELIDELARARQAVRDGRMQPACPEPR